MILKTDLRSVQEGGDPEIHERVDLRAWTTLGVGGQADLLIRCRSADGLQRALDVLATHGRGWLVLGSGTRLVPPDRGLRVPIVNLSGNLALWELDVDGAVAGGGANMAQVCRAAERSGLSGTAGTVLPGGTVGGAVAAHVNGERRRESVFRWLDVARPGSQPERIRLGRRSPGDDSPDFDLKRRVVIRARLQLDFAGETEGCRERRASAIRAPRTASPFFLAPPGSTAEAALAAGDLRGIIVGGAQLSSGSANCVCTSKTARASDVLELARRVRDKVAAGDGIELSSALCFVDEDGVEIEL